MKILAGDGEGDNFRVNLSLSAKTPPKQSYPLEVQKTGFSKKPVF
ncbi:MULTISPECIES: hypothetical protein [Microcystis]|jgi:hypothetical protein|nr:MULTISPECIES: hypothetical protein [Microcystis]MDB9429671.1 hypothetical protein [Microcystis aeruginosa CS-555/01A07]